MNNVLRPWLMKRPHPKTVKAEFLDGEERVIRIGESRSRWRDAEEALAGAVRCEAVIDDEVLRVWESTELDLSRQTQVAKRSETNLVEFARLLTDGSDRAAQRHAEAFKIAYDQQCLLVQVLTARLSAIETVYQQLLMRLMSEAPQETDQNMGAVTALLASAVGPQLAAVAGAAVSKPASNGAKS